MLNFRKLYFHRKLQSQTATSPQVLPPGELNETYTLSLILAR